MCHVAAEMERQGFDLPLLIGGATTSRVHTAVKIHPNYRRGQAIYVNDASRAVGVVSALMARDSRARYTGDVRSEYVRIAAAHARGEENKQRLPLVAARANALKLDWSGAYTPPAPQLLGTRVIADIALAELVDYIDWSPFFATWELTGKYPGDPRRSKIGRSGAQSLRRCASHAGADDRRRLVRSACSDRFVAGEQRRRRHSHLCRRNPK